jgi:hypothetical protein
MNQAILDWLKDLSAEDLQAVREFEAREPEGSAERERLGERRRRAEMACDALSHQITPRVNSPGE